MVDVSRAEDKVYDYFYDRMEGLHEGTDGWYKIDMDIKKMDETKFNVKGKVDQLKDLTENLDVEMIMYHATEKDGEMVEKFKLKKNICEFMKGPYNNHIYSKFKDTSNIPDPNVCPVPKVFDLFLYI